MAEPSVSPSRPRKQPFLRTKPRSGPSRPRKRPFLRRKLGSGPSRPQIWPFLRTRPASDARAGGDVLGLCPHRRSSALTRPVRQSGAHGYPFEGTSRPPYVRHRPISALGAPQPWAQRTEQAFRCGCLAERRADVTTRFARAKWQGGDSGSSPE